jgi:AhpD family alkylhydroperoxidase
MTLSPPAVPVRRSGDEVHASFELGTDDPGRHSQDATTNQWRTIMQARIDSPALTVPGALQALQGMAKAAKQTDIPETTLYLVELRASQINGCGVCVDIHSRQLKLAGEPDARINTVAAWRDVSYFTDAERAALALTEAVTRIADRADAVSDDVWDEAARHYDGAQLAALVLAIASINTWNRLNVATRQVGGDWVGQWLAQEQKDTAAA